MKSSLLARHFPRPPATRCEMTLEKLENIEMLFVLVSEPVAMMRELIRVALQQRAATGQPWPNKEAEEKHSTSGAYLQKFSMSTPMLLKLNRSKAAFTMLPLSKQPCRQALAVGITGCGGMVAPEAAQTSGSSPPSNGWCGRHVTRHMALFSFSRWTTFTCTQCSSRSCYPVYSNSHMTLSFSVVARFPKRLVWSGKNPGIRVT
ncbi:hypothetical protein Y032_0508g2715 [Ancylostoma ceylanicum]|uniref:Uncharacterized protein n=1 Tax=Ancylostoma ceylanicum TaxID=53326 RepID=A0A016WTR7_9BILA|nr:hypothetical protein Y032_0508g2715 [Ancylostoma ceylanicum]